MPAVIKTVRRSWSSAPWLREFEFELAFLADGTVYWSLFRNGRRVNGGLDETEVEAAVSARLAAANASRTDL